ncbi:RimJ/RimL family protein N-acetyltransferase [Aquimarina intermedia]|uniref:RimJ/RimL family protein N-acetyltransferase n=2 Tax=Aquimarina intermedia TaxID=350814 RepID=A0A5S5C8S4_9FLAO|nr:RimJ/RimL family protein N-acetyltransferase [Aquimarina intermedia]
MRFFIYKFICMKELLIREATHKDLETLLDFEQEIIRTERPMDKTLIQDKKISYYDIASYIVQKDTQVLVAEAEGQLIGSGYGQIRERKPYFKTDLLGYIGFIYVNENFRGKGVSQQILKALTEWFQNQNITEIRLTVYSENPRAIKAYEKVGFKSHIIEMRLDN